jgi:hypothetical protein
MMVMRAFCEPFVDLSSLIVAFVVPHRSRFASHAGHLSKIIL